MINVNTHLYFIQTNVILKRLTHNIIIFVLLSRGQLYYPSVVDHNFTLIIIAITFAWVYNYFAFIPILNTLF